ncbi:MAG TPA: hypothetical protein VFY87_28485 [Geminicoccaceae bacterium]|nr:hypothetical protein [Geminicoccaceae bacterium]
MLIGFDRTPRAPTASRRVRRRVLSEGGAEDDRHWPLGADRRRGGNPVGATAQADINQHEVGQQLGGQRHRLGGVGRHAADLVAELLDGLAELPSDDQLVLDDHDTRARWPRGGRA